MTPAIRSFLRAAAEGDASLLRALLLQGTNVNSTTASHQTALMLAAAFGHEDVVKLLLSSGVDVDVQDDLGLTALDWAANSPRVTELISAGLARPTPVTKPEASSPEAGVASATPTTSRVVPVTQSETKSYTSEEVREPLAAKTKLGGLAGAILRDQKAKLINHSQPPEEIPEVSSSPAPTPTAPPPTFTQSIPERPVQPHIENRETSAAPVFETSAAVDPAALYDADDETWSRHRSGGRESSDITIATHSARVATVPVVDVRPSDKSREPSKVEVELPSFVSPEPQRTSPLLWVLIVVFLGAGAYGSYRLMNYLLENRSEPVATPASTPEVAQPPAAPVKSAPVVGGDLAGAQLHVPDAEYPIGLTHVQNGNATVRLQVDQRGRVISAKAIDGDDSLRAAAEKAGKNAAFSPEKLRDKGSVINGTITYHFLAPSQESQSPNVSSSTPPQSAPTTAATPLSEPAVATDHLPRTGGPLAGAELNLPQPDYPAAAKKNGITGIVTMVVRVNRAGKVVSWRTLDGDQRLRPAALKAAKQSTFSPAKLPGDGDVVGTITYNFRL